MNMITNLYKMIVNLFKSKTENMRHFIIENGEYHEIINGHKKFIPMDKLLEALELN